jgi:RimJ/RimL family protein N-acetyltransferase
MDEVRLRDVVADDVESFFEQQRDPVACKMAAFTADDPNDRANFLALWTGILANNAIIKRTILLDDTLVGNVVFFFQFGMPSVGYWIDRAYWGRGIATRALAEFLTIATERPVYARTAFDNLASQRVLEKCGFVSFDRDVAYAAARGEEIEERIFVLRGERR